MFLFQVEIGLARTKFHRSLVEERAKNDNPILNGKGRDDDEQESYTGEEERVVDEIDPEAENRREDESEEMLGTSKSYMTSETTDTDEIVIQL